MQRSERLTPRSVLLAVTPALLLGASPLDAGSVSDFSVDLVAYADAAGVQPGFTPSEDEDGALLDNLLTEPGTASASFSAIVPLDKVNAQGDAFAEATFTELGSTTTLDFELAGIAFVFAASDVDGAAADASFTAKAELSFDLDQSVEYTFTSSLLGTFGGADATITLFDEDLAVGDTATGSLDPGTFTAVLELTASADTTDPGSIGTEFLGDTLNASLILTESDPNGGIDPTIIPTPSAMIAGLMGIGALALRRRRNP